MEWQQIIGFYHVAKLGSFTKAADATFRTQSALSQQVRNLERELDCRLLERIGKRKLRLTAAGERVFEFSETMLEKPPSVPAGRSPRVYRLTPHTICLMIIPQEKNGKAAGRCCAENF